jgi:hypothetical protein
MGETDPDGNKDENVFDIRHAVEQADSGDVVRFEDIRRDV